MTKEYELKIDPRILELLGPNLYTNIYYVLAELIANAYDADAENVYIIANRDDIRVEDDGHGMSYEKGEIASYLNVAAISRSSEEDSFTKSGMRRKMGRKGVGKLAALSVSENVEVLTISDGEKSGFVLTRYPDEGSKLEAIEDGDVSFEKIDEHGSAIVMRNPQYRLHRTLSAVKRNLLKIFPLVNASFRIHIIRGNETEIIDDFDKHIMGELSALISLGEGYSELASLVPDTYPAKRDDLVSAMDSVSFPLEMKDRNGELHEYILEIDGWIGTYKTTKGRKAELTDFPDNFVSLFANNKMGEFNILPIVGQNKLGEVYVVGQLHVDLFELSELPDMALSNRQGYKSDDPRYEAMLDFVRSNLLPEILRRREIYTDLANREKKERKLDALKESEERLRKSVDDFRQSVSTNAAEKLIKRNGELSASEVKALLLEVLNEQSPDIGLKSRIDEQKKKLLISQTLADKPFADVIYQMLLYNNFPADEIIYTNCDDEVCRVPEGYSLYDYLRLFFVESYSTEKILALFVTSDNTQTSWGAITEVGAAWITQVDHKIFNISPFSPGHPLDNSAVWQSTNRDAGGLWMTHLNADILCVKIEDVCDQLGFDKRGRADNMSYLETLVQVRES